MEHAVCRHGQILFIRHLRDACMACAAKAHGGDDGAIRAVHEIGRALLVCNHDVRTMGGGTCPVVFVVLRRDLPARTILQGSRNEIACAIERVHPVDDRECRKDAASCDREGRERLRRTRRCDARRLPDKLQRIGGIAAIERIGHEAAIIERDDQEPFCVDRTAEIAGLRRDLLRS